MLAQANLPKWVAVVTLAAVSWGCAPKVQRQVTVLESVGTRYCHRDHASLTQYTSGYSFCDTWGEYKSGEDPYNVCLAGLKSDVISRSDFTSLLEKGATVVGNPAELEVLLAPFARKFVEFTKISVWTDEDDEKNMYRASCNVRKYIMEGNAAMFDRTSP